MSLKHFGMALVLAGCGGGSCPDGFVREAGACVVPQDVGAVDAMSDAADASTPFEVLSVVPEPDAVDVDPDAIVQVRFSRPVDATSIVDAVEVRAGDTVLAGDVELDDSNTLLFFRPDARAALESTLVVTLAGSISSEGETLGEDFVWSFAIRAGEWREPIVLEMRSDEPEALGLDMDENGNAFATWVQGDVSWAAHHDAVSGWASAETLNDDVETVGFVRTAFDPGGNAWAVWIGGSAVYSSRFTLGTGFAVPEEIGANPNGLARLIADGEANATAVWPASNTSASRYRRGLGWGVTQNVGTVSDFVSIASDDAGEVMAVWGTDVHASLTTGGAWGDSTQLDSAGARPRVVRASDAFVAAWLRGNRVFAARYESSWSEPVEVTADAREIRLSATDRPVLVWRDDADRIWSSDFTTGIGWSTPQQIATGNFPSVAANSTEVYLTYVSDGSAFAARWNGASWSAPATLAAEGVQQSTIGVDASGRALAAYLQSDGAFLDVIARTFD